MQQDWAKVWPAVEMDYTTWESFKNVLSLFTPWTRNPNPVDQSTAQYLWLWAPAIKNSTKESFVLNAAFFIIKWSVVLVLEGLTRVAVVGHEEVPFLSIIACQLQLQHFWVVPHTAPLNVNRRLLPPTTCRVFGWPVHLVQSSLWVK